MTESEVAQITDPTLLLRHAQRTGDERKLRLFAVATAAALWRRRPGWWPTSFSSSSWQSGWRTVACPTRSARPRARRIFRRYFGLRRHERTLLSDWCDRRGALDESDCWHATLTTIFCRASLVRLAGTSAWERVSQVLGAEAAALVRCVFGNPFRPVKIDPSWLTGTVTAIAKAMYESRDFSAHADPGRRTPVGRL